MVYWYHMNPDGSYVAYTLDELIDQGLEPMQPIEERMVAKSKIMFGEEQIGYVSTVFLSLDHAFGGGPPVLWETLVYEKGEEEDQARYRSLEEAKAGHELLVSGLLRRHPGSIALEITPESIRGFGMPSRSEGEGGEE